MDFTDKKCVICDKTFSASDDIVVCPECGSPMHRDCYDNEGCCPNQFRHGHFDYAQSSIPDDDTDKRDDYNNTCPRCGATNDKGIFYCRKCGAPLDDKSTQNRSAEQNTQRSPFGAGSFQNMAEEMTDPLGGVPKDTLFDNDITAGETAKYVKQNTQYFIRVFGNISANNKSRFNFSAALFSGGYFLYRKMYAIGGLVAAIEAAILIFTQYVSYYIANTLEYTQVYTKLSNIMQSGGNITDVQKALSVLSPAQIFIMYLPWILNILYLIIMFTVGFTANRLYYVHCRKQINRIKKEAGSSSEAENQLQTKGGVNLPMGVVTVICYLIILYLPGFLI